MEPSKQSTGREATDSGEGAAPAAVDAGGHDWRAQLQPEDRAQIVNRILETLKKHIPESVEGLSELQKVAVQFEEKICTAAISESDYLRKIYLKILCLESHIKTSTQQNPQNTQQNPQDAQVAQNQRPSYIASEESTAQSDYPGAGDWQEELYQMIKTMKNKYLPELSDLYRRLSMKLEHIDNHMPDRKLTDHYEKMKNFKSMLERILQLLQKDRSCVRQLPLSFKDKLHVYERQIVTILNCQRKKQVQTSGQSAEQTPSCSTSRIPVDSTTQTGYPGAGDVNEELCQLNKTLKDQYVAGLNDLYKISTKLLACSDIPSQKPRDQDEEMKSFKLMLDRSLHPLQIGNGSVQLSLEESIPMFKRQITSILNSEEWKPELPFQQSDGPILSTGSNGEPSSMPLGTLSLERSNVKRLRPCLNDDTCS